jgi:hypothetical protein
MGQGKSGTLSHLPHMLLINSLSLILGPYSKAHQGISAQFSPYILNSCSLNRKSLGVVPW